MLWTQTMTTNHWQNNANRSQITHIARVLIFHSIVIFMLMSVPLSHKFTYLQKILKFITQHKTGLKINYDYQEHFFQITKNFWPYYLYAFVTRLCWNAIHHFDNSWKFIMPVTCLNSSIVLLLTEKLLHLRIVLQT